jgi:hypothetical protein
MKRDGENTPPDEPEPRLIEVAVILQGRSSASSEAPDRLPLRIDWMVA